MASTSEPGRVKIQAWLNLDTYEGWAVARLLSTNWKNNDLCRTIVREWLVSKSGELRSEHGVSREAWERERGGNVRQMPKGRNG